MWFIKIRDFTVAAVIIICSIIANGSSYAVSLSPGSTQSDALGVDGLSVTFNGMTYTYNVTFENIGYDILYGCDSNSPPNCTNPPTFEGNPSSLEGNEALANAAAGALASALNILGVTGISGVPTSAQQPYANILIPYTWYFGNVSDPQSAYDHFCSTAYVIGPNNACDYDSSTIAAGTWQANWNGPIVVDANGGDPAGGTTDFTLFTPVTTTPLPAALPLLATGLGAIGLFGWRRKRKAQAVAA